MAHYQVTVDRLQPVQGLEQPGFGQPGIPIIVSGRLEWRRVPKAVERMEAGFEDAMKNRARR